MRRLRLLVVEDNADTCELVCEMLHALGHDADGCADGDSALLAVAAQAPDVLITDLSLPGMHGLELARQALAALPELRVIVATGHGTCLLRQTGLVHASLQKPFDLDQLAQALRQVAPQARAAS